MAEGIYRSLVSVRDEELTTEDKRLEAVGHCDKHPGYRAMRSPAIACPQCARMWNRAKMLAVPCHDV